VQVPRLADDADRLAAACEQRRQAGVVLRGRILVTRGTKGGDDSGLQVEPVHTLEELDVLGVAAREAAFDEVNAEVVKPLHDAQLVLHREGHALALGAVAQCGVVEGDHRRPPRRPRSVAAIRLRRVRT